jgi:hypothetical protein
MENNLASLIIAHQDKHTPFRNVHERINSHTRNKTDSAAEISVYI